MKWAALSDKELRAHYNHHNHLYYDLGESELSDAEYDLLRLEYERRFGEEVVPASVPTAAKVKLPYVMASLNKPKQLSPWLRNHPPPYYLSDKLDGISVMYIADGNSQQLLTRGNGIYGQDISHILRYINHGMHSAASFIVRGELVMKKSLFREHYSAAYKTPRNLVASVATAKSPSPSILRHMDVVFYAVYEYEGSRVRSMERQYELLAEVSANVVWHNVVQRVSEKELLELLHYRKVECPYEMDGIVVAAAEIEEKRVGVVENPKNAFAFKDNSLGSAVETRVVGIEWNISKDYRLKPTVLLEPVEIDGVKVARTSGFNAAYIIANKINVGSVVRIIRSGDVIPYIEEVVQGSEVAAVPACEVELRGVEYFLKNPSSVVNTNGILHFFKKMGIKNVGVGILQKLVDAGYTSVGEIVAMRPEDYCEIDGFQGTLANKIYNEVQAGVAEATLLQWMTASNCFRSLSDKKLGLLLSHVPDILQLPLTSAVYSKLLAIKGFEKKTVEYIFAGIQPFKDFMKSVGRSIPKHRPERSQGPAAVYVFSGFRDAALKEALEAAGNIVEDNITKKTKYLIVKDKTVPSGKLKKAMALGIKVLEPSEL